MNWYGMVKFTILLVFLLMVFFVVDQGIIKGNRDKELLSVLQDNSRVFAQEVANEIIKSGLTNGTVLIMFDEKGNVVLKKGFQ